MRSFFKAALVGAAVLASCASAAPVGGAPNIADVGPHQVLIENDLSTGPQPTGAVALLSKLTQAQAAARCALLNEQLLSFPTGANDRSGIDSQLSYLTFSKTLSTSRLWLRNAAGSATGVCQAYDSTAKQVVAVACSLQLNALCTSSGILSKETSPAPDPKTYITVQSNDLSITGYRDARSYRFLGIPYADAPVGQLRLAPTRAYSGPKQISAVKFGNACPQPPSAVGSFDGSGLSEDCLFLNVWTPYLPGRQTGKLKPVAVFYYGGDYFYGNSGLPTQDGTNFASRNDVIIVSMNYRLGALGFLASKTLLEGNYAIRDQIMALKWVQENIAAFGGDPQKVSIFGQSAGGQSVTALLSSSAAKGLFSSAIVMSNPIDLPWFTRDLYAKIITPSVAFSAGCARLTEAAMVDCLRKVPVEKLAIDNPAQKATTYANAVVIGPQYFKSSAILATIEPFLPIVDAAAGVIDDQFNKLLDSGRLPNKVPTMFTQLKDEAFLFVNPIVPSLGNTQLLTDVAGLVGYSPAQGIAMAQSGQFAVNRSDPDGTRNLLSRSLSQTEWLCPQEYLLDRYHDQFPSLYAGLLTQGHVIALKKDELEAIPEICMRQDRACHTADVLPVFGCLNFAETNVEPYRGDFEVNYSQFLNDMWASFFRTHSPTPPAAYLQARGRKYQRTYDIFYKQKFVFKQYKSRQDTALLGFPDELRSGVGPFEAQCAFFESKAPGGFGGFTFDRI